MTQKYRDDSSGGNRVWQLQSHDAILNASPRKYKGCGYGWIEVTPEENIVDLRYSDSLESYGEEYQNIHMVSSAGYLTKYENGSRPATEKFVEKPGMVKELENGNKRVFVNFSAWEALEY